MKNDDSSLSTSSSSRRTRSENFSQFILERLAGDRSAWGRHLSTEGVAASVGRKSRDAASNLYGMQHQALQSNPSYSFGCSDGRCSFPITQSSHFKSEEKGPPPEFRLPPPPPPPGYTRDALIIKSESPISDVHAPCVSDGANCDTQFLKALSQLGAGRLDRDGSSDTVAHQTYNLTLVVTCAFLLVFISFMLAFLVWRRRKILLRKMNWHHNSGSCFGAGGVDKHSGRCHSSPSMYPHSSSQQPVQPCSNQIFINDSFSSSNATTHENVLTSGSSTGDTGGVNITNNQTFIESPQQHQQFGSDPSEFNKPIAMHQNTQQRSGEVVNGIELIQHGACVQTGNCMSGYPTLQIGGIPFYLLPANKTNTTMLTAKKAPNSVIVQRRNNKFFRPANGSLSTNCTPVKHLLSQQSVTQGGQITHQTTTGLGHQQQHINEEYDLHTYGQVFQPQESSATNGAETQMPIYEDIDRQSTYAGQHHPQHLSEEEVKAHHRLLQGQSSSSGGDDSYYNMRVMSSNVNCIIPCHSSGGGGSSSTTSSSGCGENTTCSSTSLGSEMPEGQQMCGMGATSSHLSQPGNITSSFSNQGILLTSPNGLIAATHLNNNCIPLYDTTYGGSDFNTSLIIPASGISPNHQGTTITWTDTDSGHSSSPHISTGHANAMERVVCHKLYRYEDPAGGMCQPVPNFGTVQQQWIVPHVAHSDGTTNAIRSNGQNKHVRVSSSLSSNNNVNSHAGPAATPAHRAFDKLKFGSNSKLQNLFSKGAESIENKLSRQFHTPQKATAVLQGSSDTSSWMQRLNSSRNCRVPTSDNV